MTLSRRLLAIPVAMFVAGVSLLAAPSSVAAAWGASVVFPAAGEGTQTLIDNLRDGGSGFCVADYYNASGTDLGDWSFAGAIAGTGECRYGSNHQGPTVVAGFDMASYEGMTIRWRGSVQFADTGATRTLQLHFCTNVGPGSCTRITGAGNYGEDVVTQVAFDTFYPFSMEVTVPVGARRIEVAYNGNYSYLETSAPENFVIELDTPGSGGDCIGSGELAWDDAVLTSTYPGWDVNSGGWGSAWSPSRLGCLNSVPGFTVHYQFEGASDVGDTFIFRETFLCATRGPCGVRIQWVNEFEGVVDGTFGPWIWQGRVQQNDDLPAHEFVIRDDLPAGATGVRWIIDDGTYQIQHTVSNVEGTGEDGEPGLDGSGGGGPTDPFGGCEPPTDPLDVPGWLGYIACLTLGVPAAIAIAIASLLEFLFVPTDIGEAWEAFVAEVQTHAPFSWVAQVASFLIGGLTGGNLAGASVPTSLTIMGASVTVDFGMVFGELGWLRVILAGVIYLGCGMAIWRSIGRTLGGQG